MRKVKALLIVVLLAFGIGVGSAAAAPVAATSALAYIWIRNAPSSAAATVYTVYPTNYATMQTTGNTSNDGYQTWAEVTLTNNPNIRGWVEQGSLVSAGQTNVYTNVNQPTWQAQPNQQWQNIPGQAPQNGVPAQNIQNTQFNQQPWMRPD